MKCKNYEKCGVPGMMCETRACFEVKVDSSYSPPVCSELSQHAQDAIAWMMSEENRHRAVGEVRSDVIKIFGTRTDEELQNYFCPQNANGHQPAGAKTTKEK